MAETPTEKKRNLPSGLIKLCHWFWSKQPRIWSWAIAALFGLIVWLISWLLTTDVDTRKKLLLQGVIDNVVHNGFIYVLIFIILIVLILSLSGISWVGSHIPIPTEEEKPDQEQKQAEHEDDHKRAYLRTLRVLVEQLPRLGLGVSDLQSPSGVSLADVFIPMEFRASLKALKLLPFGQDEITTVTGLDRQHRDYLMIDTRGEWERTFMKQDRIDIPTLWQCLSPARPAAVIQGAPGIGKSTLLSRITLSMIRQALGEPETQLPFTSALIPILIFIREYADYLAKPPVAVTGSEQERRSLLAFLKYDIKRKLEEKGVAEAEQIAMSVVQCLRACHCLVMFDGLDEVSDKTLQHEIQQAIHDFIEQQRHPEVQTTTYNRFLITSRVAEYDAPALEGYRYFLLAELSKEQISGFLPRWYQASISGLSEEAKQARIKLLTAELTDAVDKNDAVRKLAENPLLLTLMAVMLHNGTRLPERRVELYQAVAKTLLESRNAIKGLPELYEEEAIQRLGPLAFTMQEQGNSLARRSEVEAAIKQALASPSGSGVRSEEQVTVDVSTYIESIGRRGGLFVLRTGDYYGFIHRSFQEYFAARHMLREIERKREKIKEYVALVRNNPNTLARTLYPRRSCKKRWRWRLCGQCHDSPSIALKRSKCIT